MTDSPNLKYWLHRDLTARDKLLIILMSFNSPCQIKQIGERASDAGFRIPKNWNPSSVLRRSNGLAIRTTTGWELTDEGKRYLNEIGVTGTSPVTARVATQFQTELSNIISDETRSFVEEAIICYQMKLYRSAIVMSWIGAVAVLYDHVLEKHLQRFNTEARRINSRWRDARTTDDLTRMRESDFLDRIATLSIIGRDTKNELKQCLKRRNSCGHPNSYSVGENMVANHLEVLLLNVFTRFP